MITIKKPEEIEILRDGGRRHAEILRKIAQIIKPGIETKSLNDLALELVAKNGDTPSFLHYRPRGAKREYPDGLCVSVNDEIVHGISSENNKIIKGGDLVSIDLGLTHKGLITDAAITVIAGKGTKREVDMVKVNREALDFAISKALAGADLNVMGKAIEEYVKPYKFAIFEELGGHGVGYSVHEDPHIFNIDIGDTGIILKPNMVLAIEPQLGLGGKEIRLGSDGYTYLTKDGSKSSHFEHTVVIREKGSAEVLTL
jgi:methionyl aminopeptidase